MTSGFEDNHWDGFNDWLYDVSKHRGIRVEQMEKLAMGRVWTGRQAKENRLIDEVGGLDKAIAVAKELAGIPADQQVTLVHYPKKKGLLETLAAEGGAGAAASWAIYRFVHEDLARTLEFLTTNQYVAEKP